MLSKRIFFFSIFLSLNLFLFACGSAELYPVGSVPVANPQFPASTWNTQDPSTGNPSGDGLDPNSNGAQPSLGELGAADNDGGTTDEPQDPLGSFTDIQAKSPSPEDDSEADEDEDDDVDPDFVIEAFVYETEE